MAAPCRAGPRRPPVRHWGRPHGWLRDSPETGGTAARVCLAGSSVIRRARGMGTSSTSQGEALPMHCPTTSHLQNGTDTNTTNDGSRLRRSRGAHRVERLPVAWLERIVIGLLLALTMASVKGQSSVRGWGQQVF